MEVLADHCVPEWILDALREQDIRVTRVVDLADPRATDKDVAALARRRNAVLLTADTDFQRRRDFQPRRTPGIVLLKDLHAAETRVVRRLLRLLADGPDALRGTLVVLDRRSARVRR